MRILVTGGTGFVGREVVRQLSGVGNKVACLVRDAGRARSVLPDKVELHPGDLSDAGSLRSALNECGAVIHLVGIIRERGRSTFEEIHVRGTTGLLKAASEVLTYNQVYESIARILGKREKYIHVPIGMVKAGAFLMESLLPKPLITGEQLIMLQDDNVCDPSEATQEFGLEPETFKEGIRAYLNP